MSACGTPAKRQVRVITWRGAVGMDGSVDALPTEAPATAFLLSFFVGVKGLRRARDIPMFPGVGERCGRGFPSAMLQISPWSIIGEFRAFRPVGSAPLSPF